MATVAVDVPPSECESGDVPCAHTSSFRSERTGTSSVVMQHGTVKRMGNRWASSNNTGSSSSGALSGKRLTQTPIRLYALRKDFQRNCILKERNSFL
jgi:hypothetical protein